MTLEKYYAEQIALWRDWIKKNLTEALDLVPDDKINWAPAEGMMKLGDIFLHISETSDWWYYEVMKKRESVELATGKPGDKATIAKHMTAHWERMEEFFAELPAALDTVSELKRKDKVRTFTGSWIFTHLLEHDIHHRSQIHQYLRILGIKPPGV